MKFKMAATAGLSLTLDPMGKMFHNASSMKRSGGHLGFPIGIKIRNFVEDLPMIIPGQFDFNLSQISVTKELLTLEVQCFCNFAKSATSKRKLRTTQMTKKEFARLKTEPLNILRIKERFALILAGSVEERTVFSPMSHTFTVETHIPGARLLKSRNKLIRIADTSAGGWATVREYEQNEIADNSDDEKRIKSIN
jgi:hypothetical protein